VRLCAVEWLREASDVKGGNDENLMAVSVLRGEMKGGGMDWPYWMHGGRAMREIYYRALWREVEMGKDVELGNELLGFKQEEESVYWLSDRQL